MSPINSKKSAGSRTSASHGRANGSYLTYAWSRMLHGSSMYNPPSRFLDEIPAHLVTEAKGSRSSRERQSANNYGWSGSRRDDDDYSPAFGRGGRVNENREQMVEAALRARGAETTGAETLGSAYR